MQTADRNPGIPPVPNHYWSNGFSIIEILIGLFLMVMAVLAIGQTSRTSARAHRSSYSLEQAGAQAQAKLEILQAASARSVVDGSDVVLTPENIRYDRSWTVIDKGLQKEVHITVSWTQGPTKHSVNLVSLVK